MIAELNIVDVPTLPIAWWKDIKQLKGIKKIEFSKGLNVIFGRNNSGRSSLLSLLAKLFHAEERRFSTITRDSMGEIFHLAGHSKQSRLSSVKISHDGKGVVYYTPHKKPVEVPIKINNGIIQSAVQALIPAPASALGSPGVPIKMMTKSILTKGTSGRAAIKEIEELIDKASKCKPPSCRLKVDNLDDLDKRRLAIMNEWLKPNIKSGPPTLLLDEPDKNLDIPRQRYMWKMLSKAAIENQIIVSSNSLFCLDLPDTNYIELSDGYIDECRSITNMFFHKAIKSEDDKMYHMLAKIETAKRVFDN